jgi:beta-galactosidase/beta-glucuronidase
MKHTQWYKENYPRPQFVKNDWKDLCGEWDFVFDDADVGEEKKYYNDFPESKKIIVPFSYQTKESGIYDETIHTYIWYKKELIYDLESLKDNRLLLNFEGSDYITKVWVNGNFIGTHTGGYTRFTLDITSAVLNANGFAKIVVKSEDTLEATQPRGKQSWMNNSFGCWYQATNGIWKPVWTEIVPKTYLKSVKITPNFSDYFVEFESIINKFAEGFHLKTEISFDGTVINETTIKLTKRINSFKIDITNDLEPFKVHFWTPESPKLYDVTFTLNKEGKTVETVGSYFGVSSFRVEKDLILQNNNPVYLKMVLFQGYHKNSGLTAPNEETIKRDIEIAKELGFNGIRMHQKIEDERFYYYADILGMFVWAEMPSPYEFKDATIDSIVPEWMSVVTQFYNHPSVVAWVPLNESWGVPRIVLDSTNQKLAEALYNLTKAYDRYRPVISNDGWEHTKSDIMTLHNYAQDAVELGHFYNDIDKMLDGKNIVDYTQTRLPYANGYSYDGEPIVISEFAGIGYQNGIENKGWGYGKSVTSSKEFVERLTSLVKALRANDRIAGFCITQLTDVETEINGLLDIDRIEKADLEELKKAIKS